jgi:hypothetical protein
MRHTSIIQRSMQHSTCNLEPATYHRCYNMMHAASIVTVAIQSYRTRTQRVPRWCTQYSHTACTRQGTHKTVANGGSNSTRTGQQALSGGRIRPSAPPHRECLLPHGTQQTNTSRISLQQWPNTCVGILRMHFAATVAEHMCRHFENETPRLRQRLLWVLYIAASTERLPSA